MAEILLVDDDVDLAAAIDDVLTIAGHTVRIANDGRAGLAALEDRLPDLILLDIEMPVLDGPGMAHQLLIRDAGRERIPVILVSAYVGTRRVAEHIGTPYFAGKPCQLDELLGLVDRALKERIPPAASSNPASAWRPAAWREE